MKGLVQQEVVSVVQLLSQLLYPCDLQLFEICVQLLKELLIKNCLDADLGHLGHSLQVAGVLIIIASPQGGIIQFNTAVKSIS